MAREAFNDDELVRSLADQHYIPVLVDGDVEKEVMKEYGVRGFPTLKFMNSKGEVTGQMKSRTAPGLIAASQAALKEAGGLRLSKDYITLVKEDARLQKAMAREKYKDAIKAIGAIKEVGREGSHTAKAAAALKQIEEIAAARFEEAKALVDSKPSKAKGKLKKISKDFAGLDIAEKANELAASIQ